MRVMLLCLLLSGCAFDTKVPSYKLEKADKTCQTHNGVFSLVVYSSVLVNDDVKVICRDGYQETLKQ